MKQEKNANLHWIAEYADGSTVNQDRVSYGNLNRENLVTFGLFNSSEQPIAIIQLGAGKVLFYRMRVILDVSGHSSERIYIVGYRKNNGELKLTVVDANGSARNHSTFKEAKLDELEFYPSETVG